MVVTTVSRGDNATEQESQTKRYALNQLVSNRLGSYGSFGLNTNGTQCSGVSFGGKKHCETKKTKGLSDSKRLNFLVLALTAILFAGRA